MTRKTQSYWDCPRSSERAWYKPAFTQPKLLPDTRAWRGVFHRFLSAVRSEVRIEVRTGYQDETGFHEGSIPPKNEIQWPPVW